MIFFLISLLIFSNFSTAFAGVKTISYGYDTQGNRVSKSDGVKTTYYFSQYYEIEDGKERKHIYSAGGKVATVDDGRIVYHHTDHLTGSNVDTNKDGNVFEVIDYYPFGSVRVDESYGGYENDYKFTGKELDGDTGLYYYGARYYDNKARNAGVQNLEPLHFKPLMIMIQKFYNSLKLV